MTETPPPPPGSVQPGGTATATDPGVDPGIDPGVDSEHLRNYEQLRRSRTDRKVAGVAGGLGRHLNIDPTVLRVLFVVLALFSGAGIVLYAAAWLLVPEEGTDRGRLGVDDSTRNIALIVVGVLAALIIVGHGWAPVGFGFPWPLALLAILVVAWFMGRDRGTARPDAPAPYATATAPYAPYGEAASTGTTASPPPPPWEPAGPAYQPPPPRRTKTGPKLFGFTLAALLVGLGTLGLVDAAGAHVVDSAYPALALGIIGVMLVVGAFFGRAGGLIALGVVAALALGLTALAGTPDSDSLHAEPASAAAVHGTYAANTGRVFVDLSRLRDPEALDGRTIEVRAHVGEIVVVLPRGVESDVTARIDGPGGIDLPDHSTGGIGTDEGGVYGSGPATVTIDTDLRAGHIEVRNP